ncbi:MAG: hypothetical protein ACKVZH_22820 [Blastocatellia bacterium]
MQARSKLKPGQKGTLKLVELYGSRLVCVRYRYDEQSRKRFKTVELIVEESPWSPPPIKPDKLVGVRVELNETELQRKVKLAGGKWFSQHKVWQLRYDQAVALGLEARIEHRKVSSTTNPRKSKSL